MSKKDSIAAKTAKEKTSNKNQNNTKTEPPTQTYDCLRLKNQLCFPLYACSKEIIRRYKPVLDKLDLTYTQYITMMVLWEKERLHVGELGECLFLDSGTLTPLLKKLEQKGYITRCRSREDERAVEICITPAGMALQEQALLVPAAMGSCIQLSQEESEFLYQILYKILGSMA
ncbi:MAG: MarR family transcriptional regulator [Lachnospiraceae bacterium]|nr:MarR family transcriptional regulator [Lachnospiraceae bacterium]